MASSSVLRALPKCVNGSMNIKMTSLRELKKTFSLPCLKLLKQKRKKPLRKNTMSSSKILSIRLWRRQNS